MSYYEQKQRILSCRVMKWKSEWIFQKLETDWSNFGDKFYRCTCHSKKSDKTHDQKACVFYTISLWRFFMLLSVLFVKSLDLSTLICGMFTRPSQLKIPDGSSLEAEIKASSAETATYTRRIAFHKFFCLRSTRPRLPSHLSTWSSVEIELAAFAFSKTGSQPSEQDGNEIKLIFLSIIEILKRLIQLTANHFL